MLLYMLYYTNCHMSLNFLTVYFSTYKQKINTLQLIGYTHTFDHLMQNYVTFPKTHFVILSLQLQTPYRVVPLIQIDALQIADLNIQDKTIQHLFTTLKANSYQRNLSFSTDPRTIRQFINYIASNQHIHIISCELRHLVTWQVDTNVTEQYTITFSIFIERPNVLPTFR